jgi:DNA-binding IclR family transcriptional regulator
MRQESVFDLQALDPGAGGPRAILRVVQVLGRLAEHPEGRTLAELRDELQLPKTTLFTMLKTLQGGGYLQLTAGRYRLGPASVALGVSMAASVRRSFPESAREVLEGLCLRTGETALLAVLTADGMNCRYVAVIESANWLRFAVQRDSLRPAYATGTGRAMLAYLPSRSLEEIVSRVTFDRITHRTVVSRRALQAELERVRREHVSTSDSGTVAGVLSVAAPIFDAGGAVMAAVSAGGPTSRMAPRLASIQRAVRDAAEDISRNMGFAGEWPAPPGNGHEAA